MDEEDEDAIIERRRKERDALMQVRYCCFIRFSAFQLVFLCVANPVATYDVTSRSMPGCADFMSTHPFTYCSIKFYRIIIAYVQ